MNTIKTLLIVLLSTIAFGVSAQDLKKADELFALENYEDALEEYLIIHEDDRTIADVNYKIAVCYLNTNIDKSLALPFLQYVVKTENFDPNANYLLGRAYHYSYEFDKAIQAYQIFKQYEEGTDENLADVDKQIEYCQNAKELVKFPLNVTFTNLGENVNSAYPDYYPFVPTDESFVVFNSKRDDNSVLLEDGTYLANIYMAQVKDGAFSKARKVSEVINSDDGVEEVIGMTAGGEKVLMYFDNVDGLGDLFIGDLNNNEFSKPEKLPKTVNSKNTEIAATITKDGNEIYFASDRPGGYGGTDIYVTRKLPNGKWGPAQNLGNTVNTPYDEDFPNLSADGEALYFSSKGHTSMGGYDIFKVIWDAEKRKWTGVRNLGFPINTPEDNTNLRVSENGKFGYISALREGGYGDLDIYRVNFNELEPRYTVITGFLKSGDSKKPMEDIYISVTDLETDEEYGSYLPNPNTMRYVIILPPGHYNLFVEVPGYEEFSKDIDILGKGSFRSKLGMDIELKSN